MLDYFTLPSLEHLKIGTIEEHPAGWHNLTILHNFLERSKCPLRSFAIQGPLSDGILIDYLLSPSIHSIPEVQITIYGSDIEKRLLKILETYPNAETTFPSIICWIPDNFLASTSIGWKNLAVGEKLIFSWMAGKICTTTTAIF